MLQTNVLLQKIRREITVITCDRVIVLAFCTSSDDILSMYQVLINPLLYFQRNAPDKLNIAKYRKGSNSVNTGELVVVLAFCDSSHGLLSVYQSPFYYLNLCRDMLLISLQLQKLGREITPLILVIKLWFLHSAYPLMALNQCIRFI